MRGFDYFLELDQDEMQIIIKHFPNAHLLFLRALKNHPREFEIVDANFPHLISKQYRVDREVEKVTAFLQEESKLKILDYVLEAKREGLIRPFKFKYPQDDILNGNHLEIPRDGKVSLFYDDGVMAMQGEMNKGAREGDWIVFYPDQTPCAEGTYHQGNQVGEWSFFYQNGDLKSQGLYDNNEKHETWKEYDLNGEFQEILYQHGKMLQAKKQPK